MGKKPAAAIVGLGRTEFTRAYTASTMELAARAVQLALTDAGMNGNAIDGLIVVRSPVANAEELSIELQTTAGLGDLSFSLLPEAEGTSTAIGVQIASMAIREGSASNIVLVFADAPLKPQVSGGAAYAKALPLSQVPMWESRHGLLGPAGAFALMTRRHMAVYGTTEEQLGHIAMSDRKWAQLDPKAMLRKPMTLADYLASPYVIEPLHVLDCCYPVNGAIAFVITSVDRAKDSPHKPVYIHGYGQAHNARLLNRTSGSELETAASMSGESAYKMAGITARDVTVRQFYEAFSVAQWLALEDYGFCKRGESGQLVASGATAPGGSLPTNTNGGHLSGSYLQGATPLSEGVLQARGEAGERQVESDVVLVTNSGGWQVHHSCLILSPHASLR